jgi:hypothetical protein
MWFLIRGMVKRWLHSKPKAWYENKEGRFDAFQRYSVTIYDAGDNKPNAKLSVVFHVVYSSNIPMSDDSFNIFKSNLILSTWPYLRELAHNIISRMGWPPFIAPVYRT